MLGLAAAGLADKNISNQLGVSYNTLNTYWKRIRQKLGDFSRSALTAAYARETLAPPVSKQGTSTEPILLSDISDPDTLRRAAIFYATALEQAQETLARADRASRLLVDCSRQAARVTTEEELLNAICKVLTTDGGYKIATVLFPVHDKAKAVRFAASSGDKVDYLDSIRVTWGGDKYSGGVGGRAIRTGRTQVNQDFLADPNMAPWSKSAFEHGIQSSIGIPLKDGDRVVAVLAAYAGEPSAFEEPERTLLEEVARILGARLADLRRGIQKS